MQDRQSGLAGRFGGGRWVVCSFGSARYPLRQAKEGRAVRSEELQMFAVKLARDVVAKSEANCQRRPRISRR